MKLNEDILDLIIRDHKPLKKLIESLKSVKLNRAEKEGPLEEFVPMLMSHAKAEEKSLYLQMKDFKDLRMESLEGETEHTIAEELIHEINATADDDQWCAKVKVLADLVESHIQKEEDEILKNVEQSMDPETRQSVGVEYTQIKSELDRLIRPKKTVGRRDLEQLLN